MNRPMDGRVRQLQRYRTAYECARRLSAHIGKTRSDRSRAGKEIAMTETTVQLALGKQKIVEDLSVLLTDSEEMLRLAAAVPGEGIDALRERLRAHVDTVQTALTDAQSSAQRRYRSATVQTERYVRQNPWRALGIAAGVGFLFGVLAAR